MTTLEFTKKKHYGRTDHYPACNSSKSLLELKKRWARQECKSFSKSELEALKELFKIIILEEV